MYPSVHWQCKAKARTHILKWLPECLTQRFHIFATNSNLYASSNAICEPLQSAKCDEYKYHLPENADHAKLSSSYKTVTVRLKEDTASYPFSALSNTWQWWHSSETELTHHSQFLWQHLYLASSVYDEPTSHHNVDIKRHCRWTRCVVFTRVYHNILNILMAVTT